MRRASGRERLRLAEELPRARAPLMQAALCSAALCSALLVTPAPPAAADDAWPGLWGPTGDGRVGSDVRLPRGAPLQARVAWRRAIGSGFSAIALSGGRGFTAQQDGAHDYAVAFDASSGAELWRARLGETYAGHDGSKDGPASTPAADAGRVFLLNRTGTLFALDAAEGTVLWRHDLVADFQAPKPFYGFATSPIVSGGRVFVQAGGERNGLIAFDKASGAVAWGVSHSKTSGYSSPILATLLGVPQLVVLANDIVYGARPADGALLWSHPTGWSEEAVRPPLALSGDRVLISGTAEAKLIRLHREGERILAEEAWKTARLKNSLSPTVFEDGRLYGFGSQFLVCLDAATGEPVWRERVYGGSLILVDGHLVILGAESGDLRVGLPSATGYRELLKMPVFNAGATSVTGPALVGGRLYLRNVEELMAVDISK